MSVGLPGVGLSGVFFVLSALLALPLEIVRTIQGRSTPERWAEVLRQVAMAMAMIIVLLIVYAVLHLIIGQLSGPPKAAHGQSSGSAGVWILPMVPLLITLGLVLTLVGSGKVAQLLARTHARRRLAQAVHPLSPELSLGDRP